MHDAGTFAYCVYHDVDLLQLQCSITVDNWIGIACFYTTQNELKRLSSAARQFTQTLSDRMHWEAGHVGGSIRLQLYTIDKAGHVRCHVSVSETPIPRRPEEVWQIAVAMPVELESIPLLVDASLTTSRNANVHAEYIHRKEYEVAIGINST